MMASPWLMLPVFAVLYVALFRFHRAFGDQASDSAMAAAGRSTMLGLVIAAIGYTQHGYTHLGLGDGWAWALAAAQTALLIYITFREVHFSGWVALQLANNPFLGESDQRLVRRRPLALRRARLIVLLSVSAIVAFGLADGRTNLLEPGGVVLTSAVWLLAVVVLTRVYRRRSA